LSFMFNPSPYNEPGALNHPKLSEKTVESLTVGIAAVTEKLANEIAAENTIVAFEGYPSAEFAPIINMVTGKLTFAKKEYRLINVADYYLSSEQLEKKFAPNLPKDRVKDPILLFGKRLEGGYEEIYDANRYNTLLNELEDAKNNGETVIIYGFGSTYSEKLRNLIDKIVYLDIIPKEAVLRAKNGRMVNIGDKVARPFKEMMRRAYYVDFDISLMLRRTLIKEGYIDFYIDSTAEYKMLPKEALNEAFSALSKMPFRCTPVYLEGVWGGQYVKSLRNVPDEMKNIAWVFDLIPMEVSIRIAVGDNEISCPFYSFLQNQEENIMGKKCVEKFDGFFPIRFNYDDTFHSSGNMSIQVHSDANYNKANFNEFGRQDESYYIVEAGHGAKTYLGFNDEIDPDEFLDLAKRSEKEHTVIDYKKYINAVESKPGVQVMIPAGTIHASGQNQVILEIGSLTVGSYTYKLYDYLRLDLDGIPRPIHTYHGERVLHKERNTTWVNNNVVQKPRTIREGDGWKETIVGEHDLLYFSLRHLEFETEIEDDTNGKFHVLSLVNGQKVVVESIDNPELSYTQNYLDIIVVPASIGRYRIRNLTNNPCIVHKTCLKEGFENDNL